MSDPVDELAGKFLGVPTNLLNAPLDPSLRAFGRLSLPFGRTFFDRRLRRNKNFVINGRRYHRRCR